MNKEKLIEKLELEPHPEGGFFKETFKSDINFNEFQTLYSSIIFLLGKEDISHLHYLKEDELWYFHSGDTCLIIDVDEDYKINEIEINEENPQYLVKKGHIFGSRCKGNNYTLVGCMVSPSFSYEHFYLVKEKDLIDKLDKNSIKKIKDMFIE